MYLRENWIQIKSENILNHNEKKVTFGALYIIFFQNFKNLFIRILSIKFIKKIHINIYNTCIVNLL